QVFCSWRRCLWDRSSTCGCGSYRQDQVTHHPGDRDPEVGCPSREGLQQGALGLQQDPQLTVLFHSGLQARESPSPPAGASALPATIPWAAPADCLPFLLMVHRHIPVPRVGVTRDTQPRTRRGFHLYTCVGEQSPAELVLQVLWVSFSHRRFLSWWKINVLSPEFVTARLGEEGWREAAARGWDGMGWDGMGWDGMG
ncbi:hypothetical protein DV515_00016541, partial [Chloebia gouldiae]